MASSVAAACNSKLKRPAEFLAQGQPETAVDAAAERRVQHQLHAAGVVEEALQDQALLGRHGAQGGPAHRQVVDHHDGRLAGDATGVDQPLLGPVGVAGGQVLVDPAAQSRHLLGQLGGPGWRLTEPERHRRRSVAGVPDPNDPRLDPADLPGVAAEKEDVAGLRLDRPVLVDGADEGVVRVGHHPVVAGLGDRPTRGDGRQPGALARPQLAVDLVVMEVGTPPAPPGLDAVAHQVDGLVELGPGELVVRGGPPHEVEQAVGPPLLGRHLGHHLLGQDVEREAGQLDDVQPAGPHRGQQGAALHQLVPGQGVQPALRGAGPAVVGPPDALQEGGDAAGRADLAHQLHRADVDAQLQRGGGDQGPEVTCAEARLHPVAPLLGQAAVVGRHHVLAQTLAQLMGQPFGQPAGVDEHQGGAVLGDEHRDAVEDVRHLLRRRHRLQLAVGQLDGQVDAALGARRRPPPAGAGRRRAAGRSSRWAAGWRTTRCGGAAGGRGPPTARGSRPDGRPACRAPRRGSRRRSPSRPYAAPLDPVRW